MAAAEEKKGSRKSELNEQLLMKEWDFDKFFKGFNERLDQLNKETKTGKVNGSATPPPPSAPECHKRPSAPEGHKTPSAPEGHKRVDSDSRIPTYGFRRENSDFFPAAAANRHSAIFLENKPLEGLARGGRRGSDTSALPTKEKSPLKQAKEPKKFTNYFDFNKDVPSRPRREKTDGEIVVKPRGDSLLGRRREVDPAVLRRRSNHAPSSSPSTQSSLSFEVGKVNSGFNGSPSTQSSLSFEAGKVNVGFNGSNNDFQSSGFNTSTLSSVSFNDFQVS